MPPAPSTSHSANPRKKPGKAELLSVAATKIIELALKEDVALADLAAFAVTDPAFALRLLAFVNNPVLGVGRRIEDVRQACSLLGIRGVRNIALSLVITNLSPAGPGSEILLANCLRRAVTARELAVLLGDRDPDSHFTAGLFLDAGILAWAREDAEGAGQLALCPAAHRVVKERAIGVTPHPVRGAEIARSHFLGPDIADAIIHHHDDTFPETRLAQVAWLTERISGLFEGGPIDKLRTSLDAAMRGLGVGDAEFANLLARLPPRVAELAAVLDTPIGSQPDLAGLRERVQESLVALSEQYESLVLTLEAVVTAKEALETQLRESNARLLELASTDELTRVANRRAIEASLRRDLARADRDASHLSIAILDIDHFKTVNDTWGHAVGDAVLTMLGQVLGSSLRGGDLVGRWGGEEFLCILPGTDLPGAQIVAQRLRKAIYEHPVPGPRGMVQVTASFGLATIRGPGCKNATEDLVRRADTALYAAKESGRDRVCCAR